MTTTNARITTLATGVTSEMIAEQTHLFYDPATGTASISFQARASLYINGAYQPLASSDWSVLQTNLATIQTQTFAAAGTVDPVTGADLSKISAAGVMLIMKAAYDVLYNQQATA